MPQFDKATDAMLNAYERELAAVLLQKEIAERQHDALWQSIFGIFDTAKGQDESARFICDDEITIAREVHQRAPQLDPQQLKDNIFRAYPQDVAEAIWVKVTRQERVVDTDKVAKAVKNGTIGAGLVGDSMTAPKAIAQRHRRPATKEDKAFLETLQESEGQAETAQEAV